MNMFPKYFNLIVNCSVLISNPIWSALCGSMEIHHLTFVWHVKNSSHNDKKCQYVYYIWIFIPKHHKNSTGKLKAKIPEKNGNS